MSFQGVNHSTDDCTEDGKRQAPIILVYGFLGPPIGAVLFLFGAAFMGFINEGKAGELDTSFVMRLFSFMGTYFIFLAFAAPLSYLFGFVQALFTGLCLAELHARNGRAGYLSAFIIPLVFGLIAYAILLFWIQSGNGFALSVVIIGVLSSLILRFAFRGLFAKS